MAQRYGLSADVIQFCDVCGGQVSPGEVIRKGFYVYCSQVHCDIDSNNREIGPASGEAGPISL